MLQISHISKTKFYQLEREAKLVQRNLQLLELLNLELNLHLNKLLKFKAKPTTPRSFEFRAEPEILRTLEIEARPVIGLLKLKLYLQLKDLPKPRLWKEPKVKQRLG
ncbi:hypothetical protein M758_11G088700 [Ceratodon purpureus]|nr:hypothetical protein M758_11G088700 [Ceratodon purpureus]